MKTPESQLLEDLITLLNEQSKAFEQFLTILRGKQQLIVQNDIDALRKCILDEQHLIQKCRLMSGRLSSFLEKYSLHCGVDRGKLRLRDIIAAAPREQALQLKNLQLRICRDLEQISSLNSENKYLVNFSIEFIKGMVQVFLKEGDPKSQTYTVSGILASSDKYNKILDFQV